MGRPVDRRLEGFLWWWAAFAFHLGYGALLPASNDWDPAYYRSVAAHLVAGDGAVTGSLWNLLWLPPSLPFPAHLHWMPLPSWILVPGLWLHPRGDLPIIAGLAATWAPMAWRFAELFGLDLPHRRLAALLGLTGLATLSLCATADSYALYGVVGGLALLGAAQGRTGWTAAMAALAALTRNDGFLLALALALAFRGWAALGVAASGPLTAAAWHARNYLTVGPEYRRMRAVTADVVDVSDLSDLVLGSAPPLGIGGRLGFLVHEALPALLLVWLIATPMTAQWWWSRRDRWVRAVWAYFFVMPLVVVLLAPGVGLSGSVARSLAALLPVVCAATAAGIHAVASWGKRVRDLHPMFSAGMAGIATLGTPLWFGLGGLWATPVIPRDTCDQLAPVPPGDVVFSLHPLLVEDHCGHPGVVALRTLPPELAQELARRYDVRWLLASPETSEGLGVRAGEVTTLLPGWEPVGGRLFRAPAE